MKVCQRKSDGSWWEPSFPDGWDDGDAIAACLSGGSWYFRRVELKKVGWRWFAKWSWQRTGEVWEFTEPGLFDVFGTKEAIERITKAVCEIDRN